jgi:hypothetical protein
VYYALRICDQLAGSGIRICMKGEISKSGCEKQLYEVGCSGGEEKRREAGVVGFVLLTSWPGVFHRALSVEGTTTLCEWPPELKAREGLEGSQTNTPGLLTALLLLEVVTVLALLGTSSCNHSYSGAAQ